MGDNKKETIKREFSKRNFNDAKAFQFQCSVLPQTDKDKVK